MHIRLDHRSGEPIYRQIVEQVKYQAACGRLEDGERLPSIRTLAAELKINPRTVVRAYEELEAAGLAVTKQGQGVFITAGRGGASAAERRRVIADMARRLFSEAARMGAEPEEIYRILQQTAEQMELTPWNPSQYKQES
jgi:GntR family transcriptional regulator